ncbi:CDPK-related kinase 3 [Ananas comosus]|uniref:CDPK-related kinase 3 n=1 Tax=Ananas comosus TaxID=4615 RepID=A0A199UJM7_ANACO|nr:CDPK-related kinase 3 [Ananas comosus]
MGQCYAKNIATVEYDGAGAGDDEASAGELRDQRRTASPSPGAAAAARSRGTTPARSSAAASPWPSPTRGRRRRRRGAAAPPRRGVAVAGEVHPRGSSAALPPPSPAKHIRASLARRQGPPRPPEGPIPEEGGGGGGGAASAASAAAGPEGERGLDKSFGYGKNFGAKYEIGKEVGRGHFGHTCSARAKKGEIRGQPVAVKIISKAKMTTPISIEDVRREVKILKSLSGHTNLVKFYDACEDALNVYIIMELCEGGELLDRILSRGGRYLEEDAKVIVVQILSVVAFCHLQGVVHRDLKPENFLFGTKEENSPMKLIDFGLSDFIRPDERLNDIVGSAYYVAPEVLHRSYSMEADVWSTGVITYILLCGSRPFWARTESGIFRSVLRADPNFDDSPWPSISPEAKDFVKRLLNKDYRKRMTAAQALCNFSSHPWLRDEQRQVPLDIFIYKLVKAYLRATPFKRAALKALSKAIPEDELLYIRSQYSLLEPNKDGRVSLENFRMALAENATEAMKESRVFDILHALEPLSYRRMDFEEFRAATISPYQLEALEGWEQIATTAFEFFEQEGNRVITIEELAQEMNLSPAAYSMVRDWIRPSDGKLSFLGYTKFLHGVTMRSGNTRHHHR